MISFPGARDDGVGLRVGLKRAGVYTFAILLILNSLDELESSTMTVLAPDLRDAFGVSNGAIVFISSASAAFFVLGAVPMGYLADRFKRARIVGLASLAFSAMVFLSGLAVSAFMLFWTRFGVGIAKANTLPVHGSLLADTYPISLRGRIAATSAMVGRTVFAISPLLVGGIAIAARVAMAVPVARPPRRRGGCAGLPHQGTAPRAVGEAGGPRRGDRGRRGAADLDGGGVRPTRCGSARCVRS